MNTRKLLSTVATAGLILVGSSLLSACTDSFVGEGPEMTVETTEFRAGKQLERYFLPPPPPPPGEGTSSHTTTASDSTLTK